MEMEPKQIFINLYHFEDYIIGFTMYVVCKKETQLLVIFVMNRIASQTFRVSLYQMIRYFTPQLYLRLDFPTLLAVLIVSKFRAIGRDLRNYEVSEINFMLSWSNLKLLRSEEHLL